MKDYEKIRADISKRFKNEIQQLKLEIFNLQIENTELKVENFKLKEDVRKYKDRLNSLYGGEKAILGLNETIKLLT